MYDTRSIYILCLRVSRSDEPRVLGYREPRVRFSDLPTLIHFKRVDKNGLENLGVCLIEAKGVEGSLSGVVADSSYSSPNLIKAHYLSFSFYL